MHKTLLAAATAASLVPLAACSGEPEAVSLNKFDPQAHELANAAPKQLPPSITASRTYRCADNSLFYVDFYNNNTAMIRTARDGMPTMLSAAEGNPPYTAEGYSVSGDGENVSINGKSCHT